MGNRSIQKNAILSAFKTLVSLVVPLITFPYVSRVLQVNAIGQFNFSNSVVGYFVLLAELGISSYALREGARIRDDREKFGEFASEIFAINIFSACVSLGLLFLSIVFVPKLQVYTIFLTILSIQIPAALFGRSWVFNIYEEFGIITIVQAGIQVIIALMLFLFVHSPEDVYVYTAICAISGAGANLVYGFLCKKYVSFKPVNWKHLKRHVKPILIIFSTTATVTLYVNSDITILGWLINDDAVGLYSASVKIYNIVKQMIMAIITVIIPRMALYAGTERFEKFFIKVMKALVFVTMPAMTGLFMISDNVIEIIAGAEFLGGTTSLRILCVALGVSLFACLFANGVLLPYRREKSFFKATLISAGVNIVLNFFLIPTYHQNAAAFTTVVAEMIVLMMCCWHAKPYVSFKGVGKSFVTVGIGCIAIIVLCMVIRMLGLSLYQETIICIGASAVLYVLLQIILKNEEIALVTRAALKRLKANR